MKKLLLILTFLILLSYTAAPAQEKYGFNFSKDWEWGEMMYGGYSVTLDAMRVLEQLQNDIPISIGRQIFRNLVSFSSLSEISSLSDAAMFDKFPASIVWKLKIDSAFADFYYTDNLSGLIFAANILCGFYKNSPINASLFSGETFISKPPEDAITENKKVRIDTRRARKIIDLMLYRTNYSISQEDVVDFAAEFNVNNEPIKKNLDADSILKYFKLALTDDPKLNLYKIINPESFANLGGVYLYRNLISRCLDKLEENADFISKDLQIKLEEVIPSKVVLDFDIKIGLGFSGLDGDQFNLEYCGDNFANIKNQLSRYLFIKSKDFYYPDVFKYMLSGKDTMYLKLANDVYEGGMLNYAVPVKTDNRPLGLLEKDFNHFRRTTGEVRKSTIPGLIDTLINIGLGSTKLFHTMGTQMCTSIEKILGKNVIKNTVITGPVYFFKYYNESAEEDPKNIRETFRLQEYYINKIDSFSSIMPEIYIWDVSMFKNKLLNKIRSGANPNDFRQEITAFKDSLIKVYSEKKNTGKNVPSLNFLYVLFSDLYLSLNLFGEAAENFIFVLNKLPNKRTAARDFGRALFNAGAFNEALILFNEMVNMSPYYTEGLLLRAEAYIKLGNTEAAKEDLLKIMELEPWNETVKEKYNNL